MPRRPQGEANDSGTWWEAIDREPTPLEAAMLTETVEQLLENLDRRERAIVELGGERNLIVHGPEPAGGTPRVWPSGEVNLPRYELGAKVATRKAFGEALAFGAFAALRPVIGEPDRREAVAPPVRPGEKQHLAAILDADGGRGCGAGRCGQGWCGHFSHHCHISPLPSGERGG